MTVGDGTTYLRSRRSQRQTKNRRHEYSKLAGCTVNARRVGPLLELEFCEFARGTGEFAADKTDTLVRSFRKIILELDPKIDGGTATEAAFFIYYKAILGFGILAACQVSPDKQKSVLNKTLLAIVRNANGVFSKCAQQLALCELSYVDQHLFENEDQKIRSYLFEEICDRLNRGNWAPPIRDYSLGMAMWKPGRRPVATREERKRPHIIAVASVKGGVGKSIIAIALTTYLAKSRKTALLDLDFSGPTAQYHFNIPDVTKALSALPPALSQRESTQCTWNYPTLLDLVEYEGQEEGVEAIASSLDLPISSVTGLKAAAVLLPDSPTYCAQLSKDIEGGVRHVKYLRKLDNLFRSLCEKRGYENIVLDLRPGLFGVNGEMLRWLCNTYPTQLAVVSSPRGCDVVTSMYEASWLAAEGDFKWSGAIRHFVNMWPEDNGDLVTCLDAWANRYIREALIAAFRNQWTSTTSGAQVYSWRLWSYLYLRSIESSRARLQFSYLPYNDLLRDIMTPPLGDDVLFQTDVEEIINTDWFDKHLKPFAHELRQFRGEEVR